MRRRGGGHRPHLSGTLQLALLAVVVAFAPAPVSGAATTRPVVTDAIAAGRYDGHLGAGPGPVAVPRNGWITYVVMVSPPLPREAVGIWTRPPGGTWQLARSIRIWADGSARTYLQVGTAMEVQGRLEPTAAHAAAFAPGRTATVNGSGHEVLQVACDELAGLPAGSIAARAAGLMPGQTLDLDVCASGGRWSVADADAGDIIVKQASTAAGQADRFDVTMLHSGLRAVRLVQRASSGSASDLRALLVILKTPALAISIARNVAITPPVPCGNGTSCNVRVDVFAPAATGPWPVVVLLRGGPGGLGARTVYDALAERLASDGVVVYNADYRDAPAAGGQYPRAFDDAACAVRFARATAARYGGRPATVTLVGHSLGAYVGSVVSLSANDFNSACLATGSGVPETFVGISGPYLLGQPNLLGDFSAVLGGTPAQTPYAWRQGNPLAWVGRRRGVRFRLIHGVDDPTVDTAASVALDGALVRAGYDVALMTVAGGTHVSVIGSEKGGQWAIAMIQASLR